MGLLRRRYASLSDEELMEQVCAQDAGAFEAVVARHSDVAFSLAYRMCGRRDMAEDIVQEAFLSIWRSSASYERQRGTVRSWVLTAVHNRAVDAFRRSQAKDGRDVYDDTVAMQLPARERTDSEAERRDDAQRVRGALDTLPEEQLRVIELAYFGGFSNSEIAEMLGLPAGTVKGRMRLGMAKLRTALPASMLTVRC